LVPKNFALALPLPTAKVVVPFQALFTAVFKPLILLFNSTANAIIRSFGVEPKEELSGARSAEELSSLLRRSATEGALDTDQATLLGRTLRFDDFTAVDLMTPRVQMAKVRATDSAEDVVQLAQTTGFSRFPVIGEDADDIVGVVHVKRAFAIDSGRRREVGVVDLQDRPLRIPESKQAGTLLGLLRRSGLQMAIVTDEYGGTAGLVTLEDLVEELVGELADEHDRTWPGVLREGSQIVFDATLRPDELVERAAVQVPEDAGYQTVAGFVADRLDRIPEVGDQVTIDGGCLRVERVDGARIDRLRFIPTAPETDPSAAPNQHDKVVGQLRKDLH
jgi:CBS domain containing-hemolysin-like protein